MDLLADILTATDIRMSMYFRAELGAPFAINVPQDRKRIRFHLVVGGSAWIGMPSGSGTFFSQGDLVLIPHGSAHVLSDRRDSDAVPMADVMKHVDEGYRGHLRYGGDPKTVELICGHFAFDENLIHPILATLPPLIHLTPRNDRDHGWLPPMLEAIQRESSDRQAGSEPILERLSEVVFIQILRVYMRQRPDGASALAALADRRLGTAISALHRDPGFKWSLERLAETAGLSRTVFAERFKAAFSVTPMHYVATWRMHKARAMLDDERLTIAEIAKAVGYASDAAFARVFKDHFDVAPGALRKRGAGRSEDRD